MGVGAADNLTSPRRRRAHLKPALSAAGLTIIALMGGFTGYFLWLRLSRQLPQSFQQEWALLIGVAENLLWLALISLPVGIATWFGYQKWHRRESVWALLLDRCLASTAYFGLTLLLGWGAAALTVPVVTVWVASWVFSLLTWAIATGAERLPRVRLRLTYHPLLMLTDGLVVATTFFLAYLVRFDGWPPDRYQQQLLVLISSVVLFYLVVLYVFGVARFIWSFVGLREALVILQAVATAALLLMVLRLTILNAYPALRIPLGVVIVHPFLAYVGLLGVRVARRVHYHARRRSHEPRPFEPLQPRTVLLVGAGHAGQLLLRDLQHDQRFRVVAFLDDDLQKIGRVINGVRVRGSCDQLREVHEQLEVEEVILSMPTAPQRRVQQIVAVCEELGIRVSTIPGLSDIVLGRVRISRLREVHMEDLLGRASIEWDKSDEFLVNTYREKRILVTGAAGSIGSELVRQLCEFSPEQLILLDKDENGLYEIGLEIRDRYPGSLEEVVADIRDLKRLERIFDGSRPEVVFHAAAFKHVPLMELHPGEAIVNNVLGSRNVVEAAHRFQVGRFVLISTDKAVNPTNIMGASKRIAEMILQQKAQVSATRFCAVRFGNVLGSRASVVPLFLRQIASGRNITVTHPDIRRYFMTIPEAVQLVIKAGSLGENGEIFLLDMGDPVKIVDLARNLIELSGLVPGQDCEIEFTGLRPGEKLYEELLIGEEDRARVTRYPKIFVAAAIQNEWPGLDARIEHLAQAADEGDAEVIRALLQDFEIGYSENQMAANPA